MNSKNLLYNFVLTIILSSCYFASFAQWNKIYSGFPNSIAFAEDSLILLLIDTGNGCSLQKSMDYGNSWNTASIISYYPVWERDLLFTNRNTGFFAGYNNTTYSSFILKTTNGGLSWDTIFSSVFGKSILHLSFPNDTVGYFSLYDIQSYDTEIMKTVDGGLSWAKANTSTISDYLEVFEFINNDTGFAWNSIDDYLYRTTDGGANWIKSSFAINYAQRKQMQFINDTIGFLIKDESLYKTYDAGNTWNLVASYANQLFSIDFPNSMDGYIGSINTIIKTNDAGLNWEQYNSNPIDSAYQIEFLNSDTGYVLTDNILYITTTGGIDSSYVWPGDANADKVVDMFDFLYLGIAYGDSGYTRPNASLAWVEQPVLSWGKVFSNAVDYSHADCNGNEEVDINDTTAILTNYGLTHTKMGNTSKAMATTIPFYLEFPKDTLLAGDTVKIPIYLGSSTTNANDIYGLAFSITYDTKLMKAGSAKVSFTNSWMGTMGSNMLSLVKDSFNQAERVDIGLTRIDHSNNSGYGEIGELEIVLSDNISGLPVTERTLYLTIENEKVISFDETEWGVVVLGDSAYVTEGLTIVNNQVNFIQPKVLMYPNPAKETLYIVSNEAAIYSVKVFNSLGEMLFVSEEIDNSAINISCKNFEAGIYLMQIETKSGIIIKKFSKK